MTNGRFRIGYAHPAALAMQAEYGQYNLSGQAATLSNLAWVPPSAAGYLPAVPNGRGFGMNTVHGIGAGGRASPGFTVLHVDRLTSSSSDGSGTTGSLGWCLSRTFPRIIVFDVSGTISLPGTYNISNPYCYVAGETAPSPGIFLRQTCINVVTTDVVLSHLNGYMGGDAGNPTATGRDVFSISAGSQRVVFSNLSMHWGCDENTQIFSSDGDCTLWQCLIAEPLHLSAITLASGSSGTGMGVVLGGNPPSQPVSARVSLLRCSISLAHQRHPTSFSTNVQIADNLVYNWGRANAPASSGPNILLGSQDGLTATDTNIEGNLWLAGPGGVVTPLRSPIKFNDAGGSPLLQGSRLWQSNNRLVGYSAATIDNAAGITGYLQGSRISGAWATGYEPTFNPSTWTDADYVELHRRKVGACPVYTAAGRRSQQYTFMSNWLNGLTGDTTIGRIYDEVTDVPSGWSNIPTTGVIQNTVNHSSGGDPIPTANAGDVMPSGYLRIEEWLHRRIASVML